MRFSLGLSFCYFSNSPSWTCRFIENIQTETTVWAIKSQKLRHSAQVTHMTAQHLGGADKVIPDRPQVPEDNMNTHQLNCQDKISNPNTHLSQASGKNLDPERCLRRSAREKAQQGDYATAVVILTRLIDRHPADAVNYNNRGLIYFQSGQMEKAIADYNTALQLNPHLDSAYNNRANYYASLGQLVEAIADYEQAIDLNFGNIRARINQGITFRQMGLYELAIENFDFALVLGKHLIGHIYAERGRTYHLQGEWNSAIADYRRALKELPSSDLDLRLRSRVETWLNELLQLAASLGEP